MAPKRRARRQAPAASEPDPRSTAGRLSVEQLRQALATEHRLPPKRDIEYEDDFLNTSISEIGSTSPRNGHSGANIVDSRHPWMDQVRAHFSTAKWSTHPFLEGPALCVAYFAIIFWYAADSDYDRFTKTPALEPVIVTVLYVLAIYVGSRLMRHRPTACVRRVGEYMFVYNVFQACLSSVTAVLLVREVLRLDFSLFGNYIDPNHHWLSFLIWSHYQNQLLQMLDTVFLICRKKFSGEMTLLHVWLRLATVWSWYMVVRLGCGGDSYFPVLVQCTTRLPVYVFYIRSLLSNGKWQSQYWKDKITKLKLAQFIILFIYSVFVFIAGSIHRFVLIISLVTLVQSLLMFTNFHHETSKERHDRLFASSGQVPVRVVFSFDSSGWLCFYHLGVAMYIKEVLLPKMRVGSVAFSGASGGACVAAALCSNVDMVQLKNHIRDGRNRVIPRLWEALKLAEETMQKFLPENCADLASNNFRVICTKVSLCPPFVMGEVVDNFHDKHHMTSMIRASSHVPILAGLMPYFYNDNYYLDGFWWASEHFIPWRSFRPDDFVIRVSVLGTPNSLISPNLWLPPWWGLIPPAAEVLDGLCVCGFEDAENFFKVLGKSPNHEDIRSRCLEVKERDFLYAAHSSWRHAVFFALPGTVIVAIFLERTLGWSFQ